MSEPEKPKARRGGRAKRDLSSMTLRLPSGWRDALDARAKAEGKTITDLIRDALRDKYHLRASA